MRTFLKHLDNFEEHCLAVLLPAMCITIFVATFLRFTNLFVLTWAEELARYLMIWILFLGIGAVAKRGEHFCVTVFTMLLPHVVQKSLSVVRMILMTVFTLFVSRFCLVVLQNQMTMGQVSPSLKWPMWTMYMAIIVGCCLMLIRYLVHGIKELRDGKTQQ